MCSILPEVNINKQYLFSIAALLGVMSVAAACLGSGFDSGPYDTIAASNCFGERPTAAKPRPLPVLAPKEESAKARFTQNLRLSMIRCSDVLGSACAIDNIENPEWHAFLPLGEHQDGIAVKKIDFDGKRVLLSKDGCDEWLGLSRSGMPSETESPIPPFAVALQKFALEQQKNAAPPVEPGESVPEVFGTGDEQSAVE